MSYGIQAYIVDIERVKKTVGSRDSELLKNILSTQAQDIALINEIFLDDIEFGEPSIEDTLRDIFAGECSDVEPENAQYGYALELICRTIGSWLAPDKLTQLSLDWISGFAQLDTLVHSPGILRGIIPIPLEFPGIGCIHNSEVEKRGALVEEALKHCEVVQARECYAEYHGWLKRAGTAKSGLLTFLY